MFVPRLSVLILAGVAFCRPALAARRSRGRRMRDGNERAPYLSVRIVRRTRVWRRPGKFSLGEVLPGTHLPYLGKLHIPSGRKCPGRWFYRVGKRQYVCTVSARPSYAFPHGVPQPVLPPGRLIPLRVFSAVRDGVPVYKSRKAILAGEHDRVVEKGASFAAKHVSVNVGGTRYLVTTRHEYVPRRLVWERKPSQFQGIRLDGRPQHPPACVVARRGAWIWDRPGPGRRRVGKLEYHTWVTVYERERVGRRRFVRIGDGRWLDARTVRVFTFTRPPRMLKGPDEKWIEVLTGQQTLVAYEGPKPVYATLVSTGRKEHPSPEGLFRIWIKIGVDRMNNHPGEAEMYLVEAVPWIMYFYKGYALHGAYWHDGFGRTMSHGCVNLAPKDARFIFEWSNPRLPPGWHSRWGTSDNLGTLIRIRRTPRQRVRFLR